MPAGENLPSIADLLREYLALITASNGLDPTHWGFARLLHSVVRRLLEHRYFQDRPLLPVQEAELFSALAELHECPLGRVGVPLTWRQVQQCMRRVVPLALRIVAEAKTGGIAE